jgi:hypothetical protein
MADYFTDNPRYTGQQLRCRFRIRKHVFLHITETLSEWSPYFHQRSDTIGEPSFSPLHNKYDCDYEEVGFSIKYILTKQGPIDGFDLVLQAAATI